MDNNWYDDYGKYKGRISERGEIYDDYGNYHGEISGKDKKLNNCPNNISKGNAAGGNFTGGTPIDGTVFLLIIIGLVVIYCVFSVGPSILNRMIDSFMIIIFLAVALLGGIVGMFCQENQFSTMFFVDYFFLMILWFMIISQENIGRGLEEIIVAILCVLIGFVIMAIIGIVVAGISYLFKALLEYLFRWKISKIVTIILLLICASIIIWWFATQEGFYRILEMIDEWNNQNFG